MKINDLLKKDTIANSHKIVFNSLVGSYNYNIATKTSDKDYKVFVYPTFSDLYNNVQLNNSVVTNTIDYTIADIRKLPILLYKANINFIEVLFSTCISHYEDDLCIYLLNNRDKFAGMNIKGFYNCCFGMNTSKMNRLHKYNDNSMYMKDKYGYNVKEACHALRVLLTSILFRQTGFQDFGSSFSFINNDEYKTLLLNIKSGAYSEKEFLEIESKYKNDFKALEDYFNVSPNLTAYRDLIKTVDKHVKRYIKNEMYSL